MLARMLMSVLFLLICLPLAAQTQQLHQPESAVYDMARQRYLISNYGDGTIVAVDSDGVYSPFASGKSSSAGLHIIDDTVYVGCGGEGVLAYNLVTGQEVMDVLIPGSVLLNDITSDTSGNLYVSDPFGNQIYKIQLSDRSHSTLVNLITWPNGLYFDKKRNRLLGCTSTTSKIYEIDMNDGSLTELVDVAGGHLDGLAEDNEGNMYVSAQGPDVVYRYTSDFTSPRETVSSGHSAPADIYYDRWHDILVVPNIGNNTVDFVRLPVPPTLSSYDFSDEFGGDNDGMMEAGETIDLVFAFENNKPDSMIATTVRLSCEDITIGVTGGLVDFGDIAPEEVVDNFSSPMSFTIPAGYSPRVDNFYLEFSYSFMGRTRCDTVTIAQSVGSPLVLLVDDNAGEGISGYYTQAFDDLLIPYSTWDIQTDGTPLSGELNAYDVVVWFTGNDGAESMDSDKILSLRDYLDGGGKLFLTGQGIAANINSLDIGFLNTYLKCSHVSTFYMAMLHGSPAAQFISADDTLFITGSGGASNQTVSDHISAMNGGSEELHFIPGTNCGAVVYTGDYGLVFFGFGFEAINSNNGRFVSRVDVLSRVLEFLGFYLPNSAPDVSDLIISPGDPFHMTDHTPEMSWTYEDLESAPHAFYQIQVGYDDDWLVSELWDSGPVSASAADAVYDGLELLDGETYYIRARSSDGALWSEWVSGSFRMNSVPIPEDILPDNSEEVDINPPVLSHMTMTDIESDTLSYAYQLFDDAGMTVLVESISGITGGSVERTEWQTVTVLAENEDYYWRVRCNDGYEDGEWSAQGSFLLVPAYVCGDANGDSKVNVGDAVYIINYVFKGGPAPDPYQSGDCNCDETTDVGDAVYLINFAFKGGSAPCASRP